MLQTWLPAEAASLANSAGSWCAVAFALARVGRGSDPGSGPGSRRGVGRAAALGAIALVALDVGYYATASARGFPTSSAHIAFWIVAAVLVGPVLGVGARWLDARHPVRRALGVAVLPTVLALEGIRSLVEVGDTTYRPYWVAQILVGVLLAVLLAARPTPRTAAVGVGDR